MKTLKIRGDISFYSGVLEALASYRFSKFELTVPAPQTAQRTVVNLIVVFLELFLGHPYVAKTS